MHRRRGNRRRSIFRLGFKQDAGGPDTELAQLFGDEKTVFVVAHQQRRRVVSHLQRPDYSILQQGIIIDQVDKLLGVGLARQGPQPCATATGKNDGYHWLFVVLGLYFKIPAHSGRGTQNSNLLCRQRQQRRQIPALPA